MSRDIHMPLSIDEIEVPEGRREVVDATVKALADSIDKIGLRHPITVRKWGERYILVAGRHRLEACKKLGREHIPAVIASISKADAELWEIDENLARAELSREERKEHLLRRKAIWQAQKDKEAAQESGNSVSTFNPGGRGNTGFASETAAATGLSKQYINQLVSEAEAEAEADDKEDKSDTVLHLPPKSRPVEKTPSEKWRTKYRSLWAKAPTLEDRDWARDWSEPPVMDRRFA